MLAWVVTSSAVVGSSAISSAGLAGQRHGDHHPLAHAAGELEGIGVQPLARARGCRRGRAPRRRARRPRACRPCGAAGSSRRSGRRWCGPATASSSAPGRSSRSRGRGSRGSPRRRDRARRCRRSGCRRGGSTMLPSTTRPGWRDDLQDRAGHHRLAASRDLADDAERLAARARRGRRRRRPSPGRRGWRTGSCRPRIESSGSLGHGGSLSRDRPRRAGRRRGS